MYTNLPTGERDPIFALNEKFNDDPRADKIDLGVGVFRDEFGKTPIMSAVTDAEKKVFYNQKTKVYKGLMGNELFNQHILKLVISARNAAQRTAVIQTPGGSGALRVIADYIFNTNPGVTVWVSNPSYANHQPILRDAGLCVEFYDYLNPQTRLVDVESIKKGLSNAKSGDVVLLHGCCHNPTGADLSESQWMEIAKFMSSKGLVPFIDIAYQGLGRSLNEDTIGVDVMVSHFSEVFITSSCSKNFGLYAERVGAALIVCEKSGSVENVRRLMANIALNSYAMPPNHGAEIVGNILSNDELFINWRNELDTMRKKIVASRERFYTELTKAGYKGDTSFILKHHGMFSSFGWSDSMLECLRIDYGIYVVKGGRVNFAALPHNKIKYIVDAICKSFNQNQKEDSSSVALPPKLVTN